VKVPIKSILTMAVESGLPDSLVERHIDSLAELVIRARQKERAHCQNSIRKWYFDKSLNKAQLFEILEDNK